MPKIKKKGPGMTRPAWVKYVTGTQPGAMDDDAKKRAKKNTKKKKKMLEDLEK